MKQEYFEKLNQAKQSIDDATRILLGEFEPFWFWGEEDDDKIIKNLAGIYTDIRGWVNHLDSNEMREIQQKLNILRVLVYENYMKSQLRVSSL